MEESISLNKTLNESEERAFKEFIQKDSLNNYITSPNGFWYTYTHKSSETYNPKFGDQLFYSCEILDINQKIIYRSQEIGLQTYAVDQQEMLEGLRNGLKLMHEKDEVTFLFPSHKVFGYLGDQNKIGINQPLIYKVKINKINKKNESN